MLSDEEKRKLREGAAEAAKWFNKSFTEYPPSTNLFFQSLEFQQASQSLHAIFAGKATVRTIFDDTGQCHFLVHLPINKERLRRQLTHFFEFNRGTIDRQRVDAAIESFLLESERKLSTKFHDLTAEHVHEALENAFLEFVAPIYQELGTTYQREMGVFENQMLNVEAVLDDLQRFRAMTKEEQDTEMATTNALLTLAEEFQDIWYRQTIGMSQAEIVKSLEELFGDDTQKQEQFFDWLKAQGEKPKVKKRVRKALKGAYVQTQIVGAKGRQKNSKNRKSQQPKRRNALEAAILKLLKAGMRAGRIKQADIADAAGKSEKTISRWLQETAIPLPDLVAGVKKSRTY
jgi:uncharacterized membrane protein